MVLQEVEEDTPAEGDLSASFLSCPHCHAINEIHVTGGEEWCSSCGLDPNQLGYSVEELSHLWREKSGIREAMERGVPKQGSRLYRFLTKLCGPHCSYSESCPQSTGNFSKCFREEALEGDDPDLLHIREEEVGRGKRKRSRKARRKAKKEKERILKEKGRAILACAGSGWYEKMYRHETKDPQESQHTGSGSGT
jgi:hypothetical protein